MRYWYSLVKVFCTIKVGLGLCTIRAGFSSQVLVEVSSDNTIIASFVSPAEVLYFLSRTDRYRIIKQKKTKKNRSL